MSHPDATLWSNYSIHMWSFLFFIVLRTIVTWLALKIIMALDERTGGPSFTVGHRRGHYNSGGCGGSRGRKRKGSTTSSSSRETDHDKADELPFWGVFVVFGIFASIVLCALGGFCIVSCKQLWSSHKKHVKEANSKSGL